MSDTDPSNPIPAAPELHGLNPGELFARGLEAVKSSATGNSWVPPTPQELARLLPQYKIESLIGAGGMGAVYKGAQPELDRPVAIKLLPAEIAADSQFISRFRREARILAKLHHPGIVAVYDSGQTSDGHLYFVMEYVDGSDLRRILKGPGLVPEQALELIVQICEALYAAHRQGVIHRDLKPENILINKEGSVKLADFGIARPLSEGTAAGITMTNMVLGTPNYMSPEQRIGEGDHRTDIFALGVMLYEMLTGKCPHGAFVPPSRKVHVDVRIDEVVLKALQEEPDLRYQQVSEMKTDVDHIRTTTVETAAAPVPSRSPESATAATILATPPSRRSAAIPMVAIAAVLIAGAGLFIWSKYGHQTPKIPIATGKIENSAASSPSPTAIPVAHAASTPPVKIVELTPVIPAPIVAKEEKPLLDGDGAGLNTVNPGAKSELTETPATPPAANPVPTATPATQEAQQNPDNPLLAAAKEYEKHAQQVSPAARTEMKRQLASIAADPGRFIGKEVEVTCFVSSINEISGRMQGVLTADPGWIGAQVWVDITNLPAEQRELTLASDGQVLTFKGRVKKGMGLGPTILASSVKLANPVPQ